MVSYLFKIRTRLDKITFTVLVNDLDKLEELFINVLVVSFQLFLKHQLGSQGVGVMFVER